MYQQERMDQIMKILKKNHYVTVDYLVNEIRYSPASIRRDLTLLQKQGLVVRSYGGVSIKDDRGTPFRFRQHSMKLAKNSIAKRAAALVKNGDTVFLDSSSTTQYMGPYLTDKKGIIVITSNMTLATYLHEHGITTYCTGGKVCEYPGILGGELIGRTLTLFNIDIAFFSSVGIDSDGKILVTSETALKNNEVLRETSKKFVFLCGSDKFNAKARYNSLTFDDIDYFVSDGDVGEEIKNKYKNTVFICTSKNK